MLMETQRDPGGQVCQSGQPLLAARSIEKGWGHVRALRGADFAVWPGEIVALIGDNGAGKSTLVKCLTGVERPDSGEILFEGSPIELRSPIDARALGVETVYQDLSLSLHLDAAANLYLGRELCRSGLLGFLGVLDDKRMREATAATIHALGVDLPDLRKPIGALSGGQRQTVAVARAMEWASRVVFLDEPTAALGVVQRDHVHNLIRKIRDRGIAVVLISHNMPEVMSVADRIEVLRLGRRVARFSASDVTMADLVGAMTGAITQSEIGDDA